MDYGSYLTEPIDFLKMIIGSKVYVKCKDNIELEGELKGYDEHSNIMLYKAIETNINENSKRTFDTTFIRGDFVILISRL